MKRLALFVLLAVAQSFAQGQWNINQKTNPMDNVTVRTASLESDTSAGAKATLVIRYTGRKVELYITSDDVLDEDPVRIKLDDGNPQMQFWNRSSDYLGLFAPHAEKLIEQLKTSKRFLVEYHPYLRPPAIAVFVLPTLPVMSEAQKEIIVANSEAAKDSPAAQAANQGHAPTPEELAALVKQGKASRCAIVTFPSGADIYIDGNRMGVSPVVFVLLRKDVARSITVKMNGYKTVERQFNPDGKIIPVDLTLEKQ